MSDAKVTRQGLQDARPGREAKPGTPTRRRRTGRRAEQPMVPPAEFASYYGKPVLNAPVWRSPDIPGYLFLGGAETTLHLDDAFERVQLGQSGCYQLHKR